MSTPWRLLPVVCLGATLAAGAQSTAVLTITSPTRDTVVSGPVQLAVALEPADAAVAIESVAFTVDGRVACTASQAPFACDWDAGDVVRGHHIRAVAALAGGGRLTASLYSRDLGFAERARTDAVLVRAIVTHRGQFVRGLQAADFEILEDGVRQSIASFANEDAPLDLVLAIDISGSMESSLPEVKAAVKQFLGKLREGDAATLVGFNDTMFLATEREKDQRARERAVDLLTAWGSTALYDATVRAVDLVGRDWGRKGIVIFSDGDDHSSLTPRDTATARVQASDAMLYTVGFGAGTTVPDLRARLESYARATGGRAFFPRRTQELDAAFETIVTDMANQYVLSYSSTNHAQDNTWRDIKVRVRTGDYTIRARPGYRAQEPPRAGR